MLLELSHKAKAGEDRGRDFVHVLLAQAQESPRLRTVSWQIPLVMVGSATGKREKRGRSSAARRPPNTTPATPHTHSIHPLPPFPPQNSALL